MLSLDAVFTNQFIDHHQNDRRKYPRIKVSVPSFAELRLSCQFICDGFL
jgi:hypothetical protein